jgi:hypothetical protein
MADIDSRVAVFRQMLDNGGALADEIERDARSLAEKLERLHGGRWCPRIDHQVHAVLIARWGE